MRGRWGCDTSSPAVAPLRAGQVPALEGGGLQGAAGQLQARLLGPGPGGARGRKPGLEASAAEDHAIRQAVKETGNAAGLEVQTLEPCRVEVRPKARRDPDAH